MASKLRGSQDGRLGRRRLLQGAGLLSLNLLIALACGDGEDPPLTTLDSTIALDDEGTLGKAPGEPYAVRTELAPAKAGREGTRRSLLVFHQLSDFRIVDEESPLRSEWVESCEAPLSAGAFRPQESLSLQAAAAMVAQANRIDRSPVSGRPVDFAAHTGNAADNAQHNELRWFLDLLDGRPLNPASGAVAYEGVQEESPADAYPELLEDAQRPFVAQALRYPWYTVVGNRDVLAQGNFAANDAAKSIAVGGQKVIKLGTAASDELCSDPSALLSPGSSDKILGDPETVVRGVTADPERRLVSRKEWIEEHFKTADAPGPAGHGLKQENRDGGIAYYALEHGPVAVIVLDTVNPGGFAAGSIDARQFAWLEQQLIARSSVYVDSAGRAVKTENEDRFIVVVSHHPSDEMNNPFPDPETKEERFRGPQLEELLHRFANVVLHVAGHNLQHRLTPKPDPGHRSAGYWEVTTGSPLDYPMQSRLLEIVDNNDGTISIFSTVYDGAAPVNPGDAQDPTPDDGVNERLLASVARQVGMRDPQRNAQAAGLAASDRNAELLLIAPFELAKEQSPTAQRREGNRRGRVSSRRQLLGSLLSVW